MSRIELSKLRSEEEVKYGVWINLERLIEFGPAQPFFPPGLAGNNGCGPALIQTPIFTPAESNA